METLKIGIMENFTNSRYLAAPAAKKTNDKVYVQIPIGVQQAAAGRFEVRIDRRTMQIQEGAVRLLHWGDCMEK